MLEAKKYKNFVIYVDLEGQFLIQEDNGGICFFSDIEKAIAYIDNL